MHFYKHWLLFSLSLVVSQAHAMGAGRAALDDFLANLQTLEARFEQTVVDTENARQRLAQGVFLLKRPDRFRWDYQQPEERLIVADGRDVWIAEHDLRQIRQYGQGIALKNTPAAILLEGDKPLDETFKFIERGKHMGMQWLGLQPQDEESDMVEVLLAFQDNQLKQLELTDKFGQITRFSFYAIQRNLELMDELFVFRPPGQDWDVFQH
jgi:outer membrane lipoprotein carrier protein